MKPVTISNIYLTWLLLQRLCAVAINLTDPALDFRSCPSGYIFDYGQCVDIDECADPSSCSGTPLLTCINKNGSHTCQCPENMQGNGIDSCGYALPISQTLTGVDLNTTLNKMEIVSHAPSSAIRQLQNQLRDYVKSPVILNIVVKTVRKLSQSPVKYRITYDVYFNKATFALRNFVAIFNRKKQGKSARATWMRNWNTPNTDSAKCSPTTLGYGSQIFQFGASEARSRANSIEKCPVTDRPITSVRCRLQGSGAAARAYFDYRTMRTPARCKHAAILNATTTATTEISTTTEIDTTTTEIATTTTAEIITTPLITKKSQTTAETSSELIMANTTLTRDSTTQIATTKPETTNESTIEVTSVLSTTVSSTASTINATLESRVTSSKYLATTTVMPTTEMSGDSSTDYLEIQSPNELSIEEILRRFIKALSNSTFRQSKEAYHAGRSMLIGAVKRVEMDSDTEVSMLAMGYGVDIVDWLLENPGGIKTIEDENLDLVLSFEKLPTKVNLMNESTYDKNGKSLAISVQKISRSNITSSNYASNSSKIKASLPEEAIQRVVDSVPHGPVNTGFILYKDSSLFSVSSDSPDYDDTELSQVLSASIGENEVQNLSQNFSFQIPINKLKGKRKLRYFRCGFLDEATRNWSTKGCYFVPGSNPPNCTCNHLTNFALIVKNVDLLDNFALGIFGKIGCSVSIIGLLWMLICYLSSKSLRKIQINQIHANLCGCLLAAYVVFLVGAERSENKIGCMAVAGILHFFLLASWGWMCVECVTMYRKLVTVFGHTGKSYVSISAVVVYSTCLVIVAATVSVVIFWYDKDYMKDWNAEMEGENQFNSFYISERLCWLRGYPLYFGFLVPVAVALTLNIYSFMRITKAITCDRGKVTSSRKTTTTEEIKSYLIRASMITFILGLTWVFAVPLALTDDYFMNQLFSWLFSIFNSLQGFFIFFFFCFKRKDVRELWMGGLKNTLTSLRRSKTEREGNAPYSPQTRRTNLTIGNAQVANTRNDETKF